MSVTEAAMPITADLVLTDAQRAEFARDGFLRIERIIDADEVARIRAALERLHERRAGRETGEQFDLGGTDEEGAPAKLPQLINPSKHVPELVDTRFRANCLALAPQLLGGDGSDVQLSCEHAILKPAHYGETTPWHQDESYWSMPNHDARGIAVWMPLQDATVANGCLWYIPGSHRGPILEHRPIGGDPRVHGLETLAADAARGVPVPLPAGGAVVHHVRSLHYAGPNRTPDPRYAYTFAFHRPSVERSTPHAMPWIAQRNPPSAQRAAAAQA
jgi:ectoine hydroxylase-related dioxygenase (phytanoyl-CoA dioxygenase family)